MEPDIEAKLLRLLESFRSRLPERRLDDPKDLARWKDAYRQVFALQRDAYASAAVLLWERDAITVPAGLAAATEVALWAQLHFELRLSQLYRQVFAGTRMPVAPDGFPGP